MKFEKYSYFTRYQVTQMIINLIDCEDNILLFIFKERAAGNLIIIHRTTSVNTCNRNSSDNFYHNLSNLQSFDSEIILDNKTFTILFRILSETSCSPCFWILTRNNYKLLPSTWLRIIFLSDIMAKFTKLYRYHASDLTTSTIIYHTFPISLQNILSSLFTVKLQIYHRWVCL